MMEWIPIALLAIKLVVFGTGMFFAIKWHYDREQQKVGRREVLRAVGKVAAAFVLSFMALLLFTFFLANKLGVGLTLP